LNLVDFLQSGQPVDLSTQSAQPTNRPDVVGPIRYPKSISGDWFDPTSFSSAIPTVTAPDGTNVFARPGTIGRNQIFGPSYRVVDMSAQKNLHLTEKYTLELHADAFNLFNTPQFTNPGGDIDSPQNFGKITSTKQFTNRQIQLAARFVF
jgi:hypothetical protein